MVQSEVGTGIKNNLFAAPLWFDLERKIEMLNKRLRDVARDSSWLSLLRTSPEFTFPAECHTKTCRHILKHASLNDFVWKQFRWILNMQLIQRGYYLLTKCPSAWVFFFCQANAPKKERMRDVQGVLSLFDQSKLFVRPSSTFSETVPLDKGGRGKSQYVCNECRGKQQGWVRSLHADLVSCRLNCITLTQWQNPHVL